MAMKRTDAAKELNQEEIKKPNPLDILLGRGGKSNNNPGNKLYQKVIKRRRSDYANSTDRKDKTNLAWEIVYELQQSGSRFLRKREKTDIWYEVSDEDSRKKVSQRLREVALEAKHESETTLQQEYPSAEVKLDLPAASSVRSGSNAGVNIKDYPQFDDEYHTDASPMSANVSDMTKIFEDVIESDCAVCGSLSDLSGCSLETLIFFGHEHTFEWRTDSIQEVASLLNQDLIELPPSSMDRNPSKRLKREC